jgi:hypothetical protein
MLMLCSGRGSAPLAFLSLLVWTAFFGFLAVRMVGRMLQSVGGI